MANFLAQAGIHLYDPSDSLELTAQEQFDAISTVNELRKEVDLLKEQVKLLLLHIADNLEDIDDDGDTDRERAWAKWRGVRPEALRLARKDIAHMNRQKAKKLRTWLMDGSSRPPSPPPPPPPHHSTPPPVIIPRRTPPLPPKKQEQKEQEEEKD